MMGCWWPCCSSGYLFRMDASDGTITWEMDPLEGVDGGFSGRGGSVCVTPDETSAYVLDTRYPSGTAEPHLMRIDTSDGTVQEYWSLVGGGSTWVYQFALCCDDDHVYVAAVSDDGMGNVRNRIRKYEPDGTLVWEQAEAEATNIFKSIAVDSSGNIYAGRDNFTKATAGSGSDGHSVEKRNSSGVVQWTWNATNEPGWSTALQCNRVALLSDGHVAVRGTHYDGAGIKSLQHINSSTGARIGGGGTFGTMVQATSGAGYIYQSGGDYLTQYEVSGYTANWATTETVERADVTASGTIWAATPTKKLLHINSSGTVLTTYGPAEKYRIYPNDNHQRLAVGQVSGDVYGYRERLPVT